MHVIGLRTGFGTIHQIEAVDVQAVVKRRKRGERCRPRPSHCSRPPSVLQPASSGYERRGLASRSQAPTTYPDSPDATRQGVAGLDAVHNCLKMGGAVVSQALASVLGSDTRSNVSRRLLFASLAVDSVAHMGRYRVRLKPRLSLEHAACCELGPLRSRVPQSLLQLDLSVGPNRWVADRRVRSRVRRQSLCTERQRQDRVLASIDILRSAMVLE